MKELAISVIGSGRWARALVGLLGNNQRTLRGHIRRVTQYDPPHAETEAAPARLAPALTADTEDATIMGALRGLSMPLAGKAGPPPPAAPRHKADSDDATMLGIPQSQLLAARKATSDDATMFGIPSSQLPSLRDALPTLDSDEVTVLGPPPTASRPAKRAESDDATMSISAISIAKLAGTVAQGLSSRLKSGSDDETMTSMTSADFAAALSAGSSAGLTASAPSASRISPERRSVGEADLIFLAVPAASVRSVLRGLAGVLRKEQLIVHSIGSFSPAQPTLGLQTQRISEVIREETPLTQIGALSGPAHADDLEEWSPAALVCGSGSDAVIAAVRQALHCQTLRIYSSHDLCGVEVARAMAGVIALASGVCEVLQFGIAARAVLVSRGAAEIARLGTALGGKERTFVGLSGIGALMAASQRTDSPDYRLGRLLAEGRSLAVAETEVGSADSLNMIRDAQRVADRCGVHMPILGMLHRWLFDGVDFGKALRDLLDDPNYAE